MRSFDNANPSLTSSEMFGPTRFLRVQALGTELAFDAASLCDVLDLADTHAPVRFGRGLVMFYEGRIILLVDYRSPSGRVTALTGAQLVIAHVQRCRFALVVDCIKEQVSVDYAEISIPDGALADLCPPYLAGCIWRDGGKVYLVDLECLLGPAIRTYVNGCE